MTDCTRTARTGRTGTLVTATLGVLVLCGVAQATPNEDPLTLKRAIAFALARHPQIAIQRGALAEARGRLETATTYRFNPELEGSGAHRNGAQDESVDYGVELSQTIEVGGKRGARKDAAHAHFDATRARTDRAFAVLRADVEQAFFGALQARDVAEIAESGATIARRMLELTNKRQNVGTASRIEVNAVKADLARAFAEFEQLSSAARAARAGLAEAVAWTNPTLPEIEGSLPDASAELPALEVLVAEALDRRSDIVALESAVAEAQARLRGAERAWIPDVTLGAFVNREEGTDTIAGGSLSIPIPIWNRGGGEVASAGATLDRARGELELAALAVRREVIAAHARWSGARAAAKAIEAGGTGALEENLDLLDRAFATRRVAWSNVLLIRRSFVDSQRALVEAKGDATHSLIDLRLAAGRIPAPLPTTLEEPRIEEEQP